MQILIACVFALTLQLNHVPAASVLPCSVLQQPTEAAALLQIKAKDCQVDAVGQLVPRGWWAAARAMVAESHERGDHSYQTGVESAVRREVSALKQRADELLLSLSPQESERIGVVRCAFQWAQNSSAIFLSVKFAHRWSSPGALKVWDEALNVSDCCFNFSAHGEHSQLRKRYALDLHFLHPVSPQSWSWQLAAAGRFTVEIRKAEPKVWQRLLRSQEKPGNLGAWDSMQAKWSSELKSFEKKRPSGEEEVEVDDEAMHQDLARRCQDSKDSPFSKSGKVKPLCSEYWPPKLKDSKRGRSSTWLVLFHSPFKMKCKDRGEECVRVRDRWGAIGKKVPEISSAMVGAVDCDAHDELCQQQEIGHMPFIRRYREGKRKTYYGEWDIDSIMQFVLS